MNITPRDFYTFSGFHSLLIGLLPFFIPVILWESGASLAEISGFISLTGAGFIITLWYWDGLRENNQWTKIIALSFIAELLLIGLLAWQPSSLFIFGLALLNGAYNCFYWSTQRAMFNHISSAKTTGNRFGNFQIIVVISLKVGILAGGYLLETIGITAITAIAALSVLTSSIGFYLLTKGNTASPHNKQADRTTNHINNIEEPALGFTAILAFKDQNKSKTIFLLDGPFLYLESYFWVLSIYLLTHQSLFTLGFIVVALTLILSVVFFLIKTKIDNAHQPTIFIIGAVAYAASWLLRGTIDSQSEELVLYSTLLIIGFFSTFFRLVFNKRFYDIAKQQNTYQYLICKSYYSQFGIFIFFGVLALVFYNQETVKTGLAYTYLWAAPLALGYSLYLFASRNKFHKYFRTSGKTL